MADADAHDGARSAPADPSNGDLAEQIAAIQQWMEQQKADEVEEGRLRKEQEQAAALIAAREQGARDAETKRQADQLKAKLDRQQRLAKLTNPLWTLSTGLMAGTAASLLAAAQKGLRNLNTDQLELAGAFCIAAVLLFIVAFRIAL